MIAYSELTGVAIRIHIDNNAKFGDPFDFFVDVVGHEGTAILKGMVGTPGRGFGPAAIFAVRHELRRLGFHAVTWTRYDAQGRPVKPDFYARI